MPNKANLKMGEPVMVNPNSYTNIEIILDELKNQLINERKWVILGCDGPPYNLASRIIENAESKYEWVTLTSGLGHLHMNQIKCLFKILDNISLDALGREVLGFKSPNAYSYFIEAKDTHKSYQALLVLLEGTACEMCRLFLKDQNDFPKTAQGFLNWCSENSNETFSFVYQIIFNFALAIYVQKVGVRMNNWNLIDAGRMKFLPLFYSFNHPIYQEVEYRDLCNRAMYPNTISDVLESQSCFNISSLPMNHQGGDFCLENKIKAHKLIAPKGKISQQMWKTLSRGLDEVEMIHNTAKDMLNLDNNNRYRDEDLYDEITTWRSVLRLSGMLEKNHAENAIKNIYDDLLSMELDDFTLNTQEKMDKYWQLAQDGHALKNINSHISKITITCDLNEFEADEE